MKGLATVAVTAVLAAFLAGSAAGETYTLVEDFKDIAWRGAPVWSGWAYEMVNGTHEWTVASPQNASYGRAYVRSNQTDWAGAVSAVKAAGYQSSITHDVNLSSGSVSFAWADGNATSSCRLQLLGVDDLVAADINFGNQNNMFMTVNGVIFLVNGSSGMKASTTVPGNMTIYFDCATGAITADANNGGANLAAGKVAYFSTSFTTIKKIRFLADQDGVSNSELQFSAAGIAIAGTIAQESTQIVFAASFETNAVVGGGYPDAAAGDVYVARGWRGNAANKRGWYAEFSDNMSATGDADDHLAAVSTNRAHSGSQSLRRRKEAYFYNYLRNDFDKKTNGVLTVEFYYWFDNVSTVSQTNLNNIIVRIDDYASRQNTGQPSANFGFGEFYTPYNSTHLSFVPNRLYYPAGAVYNNVLTVSGIGDADRWIGLRLVFDMHRRKLSILTDEDNDGTFVSRVSGTDFYTSGNAGAALSCISIYELCGSPNYFWNDSYDIYLDDIRAEWTPPPPQGTVITFR